jgi:hypothetical protein
MSSPAPEITRLLIATPAGAPSIGVVVDGRAPYWGECLSSDSPADWPTIQRLIDLSTAALVGQRTTDFRALCGRLRPLFPAAGVVPAADAALGALQQALLTAVADHTGTLPAQTLAEAFGLPWGRPAVPLYLAISDFAASAKRIDAMLTLRPPGIGYRLTGEQVAEAIGPNAEGLQRFVRELGRRAAVVTEDDRYQPAIYLALNGALGRLVEDPIRHIGKILGHCVGLQEAAGPRQLILEEPFALDDPVAQATNLRRLRDFLRRTPSSQKRAAPTLLVAPATSLDEADLALYRDTQAAHLLAFDPARDLDIDGAMTRLAALVGSDVGALIHWQRPADAHLSPRWAATTAEVALAGGAVGLVVSWDDEGSAAEIIGRRLAEAMAR